MSGFNTEGEEGGGAKCDSVISRAQEMITVHNKLLSILEKVAERIFHVSNTRKEYIVEFMKV